MRPPSLWKTLTAASVLALTACTGTITNPNGGDDDPTGNGSDTPRFARLTHSQWANTIVDLFGLAGPVGLADQFQPDPPLGRFDNNIARLSVNAALWRDYQNAAESVAEIVTSDPAILANILPADLPSDPAAAGRAFVEAFGKRAFRRPLTTAEIDRYVALFANGSSHYAELDVVTAGVRLVLEGMLQSPHFLYRTELSVGTSGEDVALTGYEVASRLSYTLINSMPDAELMAAAERGDLATADGVRAQAERLLSHPRVAGQVDNFHFQAFSLLEYADVDKDPTVFPNWTRDTGIAMQDAALLFLRTVFEEGSVRGLMLSRTAYVNAELASYYGVDGTFGSELQRVELDPARRAGFLTRLGFLTRNATLTEPDPIHRGVFINLNLLCRSLPALPNLPDDLTPVGDTNRERIDSITGPGTCGESCHAYVINPLGYALENFDALGQYRTEDNGFPVNAASSYTFEDGRSIEFDGAVQLSEQLADAPELHSCYVRQLLEYVYGRDLSVSDETLVSELSAASVDQDLSVREIVLRLVTSRAFRYRLAVQGVSP